MKTMLPNIFEMWNIFLIFVPRKIRKTSTQLSTKYKIKFPLYSTNGNHVIKHI